MSITIGLLPEACIFFHSVGLLKMGKKVRKALSFKENCSPQASQNMIPLDLSDDIDFIECSFIDENKYNEKNGKFVFNYPSDIQSSKSPLHTKNINESSGNPKNNNNALRLNLQNSYRLVNDALVGEKTELIETPCQNKILREPNSAVKKFISTLKKTPEGSYLSKSKLRNIEQWLNGNKVETVCTPPFANLSITPVNSPKQRYSSQCKKKHKNLEESSLDSEVEGVLKAIYGGDWKREKVRIQVRTEPKKETKKFFLPSTIKKRKEPEGCNSVKSNMLSKKKLNLDDRSNEENDFDDSVLSGVKIISLDSSNCSSEQMKINTKVTASKKKKTYNLADNSFESLYFSPKEKKPKSEPLLETENQKQSLKTSASKKFLSQVATKTPKKTFLASLSVSTPTSKCHPEAQFYKINFKSKKEELVKKLFKIYNTEIFDGKLAEDMNFSWNIKLRGTAGYCYNKRITKSTGEVVRLSRIEFSSKIIDRADRLRDTMIHELCHAASWVINGVLDGHGDVWNKWASRAMNRFSELPSIKRCHNYEIISKYIYKCTGCGYSIKRHSKSINIERKRCGHCYGVFELLINKKKKGKGEIPEFDTTKTLPTPNKFAMFVKENYRSVKSAKTNAKHSEIMKILSREYALIKDKSKSVREAQDICMN